MPLVERTITTENPTLHGKRQRKITIYVSRRQLQRGDRIVEPTEKQLADLAERYPDEFGEAAKARGVVAAPADADVVELVGGNARDSIEAIAATDDIELLAAALETEEESDTPRKTVIAAIEARLDQLAGGPDEDFEELEEEDDEDGDLEPEEEE